MNKICRLIILYLILLQIFILPVYSKQKYDIQIVPLYINNTYVKDIEIREYKKNILIPIKVIANVMEVPFTYDKLNKKIIINEKHICSTNKDVIYDKNEIINEYYDDFFVSDSFLSQILDSDIKSDKVDLNISIITDKKLAILKDIVTNKNSKKLVTAQIVKEVLPSSPNSFMMKSLNIGGTLNFYNYKQEAASISNSANSLRTVFKGRCLNGDLEISNDLTANDSKIRFTGLKTNLKKEINGSSFEFGNLTPIYNDNKTFAEGLVGVKFSTEKENKKYTLYSGLTDYNSYLFKEYKNNITKKFVLGSSFSNKTNEKLSYDIFAVHDNIMGDLNNNDYYKQILSSVSPSLLGFSTYKNFNNISGDTLFASLKYKHNDKLTLELSLGISNAIDHLNSDINPNGIGLGASLKTTFQNKKMFLSDKVFYYSPDFYFAGTTGGMGSSNLMNDKLGFENVFGYTNRIFSMNAKAENYISDLENKISNGNLFISDYSIFGNFKVTKKTSANYSLIKRISTNDYGSFDSCNGFLSYFVPLTDKFSATANLSFISNDLNTNTSYSNSLTQKKVFGVNYRLPKKAGNIKIENESQSTISNNTNTNSNRIRVGYTFPRIFSLTPSFNVGLPYSGNVKGLDYNVSLSHRFKSGSEVRASYYYNKQDGFLFDNIYIPSTSRSTFAIDFVENLSLYGGIRPLTLSTDDFGFIMVHTYFDKNENAKFDEGEPNVPNVSIKIENGNASFKTNKNGSYTSVGLKEGEYCVSVDKDNLLSFYGTVLDNENFKAKVKKDSITHVYIPIISTPGSIYGKVKITNELGNDIKINDLAIGIYSENGTEVSYTSVDEDMNFSISNLKPGKYTLKVDDEFQEAYALSPTTKGTQIEIQNTFENNCIIDNIILNYTQKDYI